MLPLYLVTAAIFLVVDAVMLNTVMAPLFRRHIGGIMRESPALAPAGLFYLAYVAGLVWLVSWPAYHDDAPGRAFVQGAVVGAMAYGTFEFTAWSVIRGWHWSMALTDTTWGALLTGGSAWAGVMIWRALA